MKPSTIAAILIAAFITACTVSAEAQRTTRKRLHPIATDTTTVTSADTIRSFDPAMLILSGYDKPLRSTNESIFLRNLTDRVITSVTLSIDYFDMHGRQLHNREVTIPCSIPPKATRQLTFRSWDRQKSFVYHRSQRPKRADYSPYDIHTTIISYIASPL
ncbi:MAG: hypothetical protein HDS53_01315 [Barnesiella sp.]|nr:hypothetical protein [Barnesiella sp.]